MAETTKDHLKRLGGDPHCLEMIAGDLGKVMKHYLIYVDTHPAEVTHLSEQMMTCDMCVNL